VSEKSIELRKSEIKSQKLESELTELKQEYTTQVNGLNEQISQLKNEHDRTLKAKEEYIVSHTSTMK